MCVREGDGGGGGLWAPPGGGGGRGGHIPCPSCTLRPLQLATSPHCVLCAAGEASLWSDYRPVAANHMTPPGSHAHKPPGFFLPLPHSTSSSSSSICGNVPSLRCCRSAFSANHPLQVPLTLLTGWMCLSQSEGSVRLTTLQWGNSGPSLVLQWFALKAADWVQWDCSDWFLLGTKSLADWFYWDEEV